MADAEADVPGNLYGFAEKLELTAQEAARLALAYAMEQESTK